MHVPTRKPLLALTALCAAASVCYAADDAETRELRQRVATLERRLEFLEKVLDSRSPLPPATDPPEAARNAAPSESPLTASSPAKPAFQMPPELVPEIGKIGAQVGLIVSGSSNPFHLNNGSFTAGFIDLPLIDRPDWLHGKISYEILVGMSQSKTAMQVTSNVAQVANLAVLNALNPNGGLSNVSAAVTGTGAAPFPVTTPVTTRLRLLQVVPFSLKYTSSALERWRMRPYAVLGFGTYVTIHTQYQAGSIGIRPDAAVPPDILAAVNQLYGGKAPFGGPLVAGQISQAAELEALGLPSGHGSLDFGIQGGFGLEYRLTPTLSIGFDQRFNRIAGAPGLLTTFGSRIGVHF